MANHQKFSVRSLGDGGREEKDDLIQSARKAGPPPESMSRIRSGENTSINCGEGEGKKKTYTAHERRGKKQRSSSVQGIGKETRSWCRGRFLGGVDQRRGNVTKRGRIKQRRHVALLIRRINELT